jgi:hypothetical protein
MTISKTLYNEVRNDAVAPIVCTDNTYIHIKPGGSIDQCEASRRVSRRSSNVQVWADKGHKARVQVARRCGCGCGWPDEHWRPGKEEVW